MVAIRLVTMPPGDAFRKAEPTGMADFDVSMPQIACAGWLGLLYVAVVENRGRIHRRKKS
jgi:hypothetical protein